MNPVLGSDALTVWNFFALISKLFLAKHTFINLAPFHNQVNNVINSFILLFIQPGVSGIVWMEYGRF